MNPFSYGTIVKGPYFYDRKGGMSAHRFYFVGWK